MRAINQLNLAAFRPSNVLAARAKVTVPLGVMKRGEVSSFCCATKTRPPLCVPVPEAMLAIYATRWDPHIYNTHTHTSTFLPIMELMEKVVEVINPE